MSSKPVKPPIEIVDQLIRNFKAFLLGIEEFYAHIKKEEEKAKEHKTD